MRYLSHFLPYSWPWYLDPKSCPSAKILPFSLFSFPFLSFHLASRVTHRSSCASLFFLHRSGPPKSPEFQKRHQKAELAMSRTPHHSDRDPEYPEKASIHHEEENHGPFRSPPNDHNNKLPPEYIFKAALATILTMLLAAALVWRFYVPPPLVL